MRVLRRRRPMDLHTIGIDLGKTVFHLVGLNLRGEVVVRKKFSRTQLLRFTGNVRVGLIGLEACGGAHFLGRALREQGLIPAQYVKPYVKTNKSDYIDAEAIAEAVARPTMRFVPIKTDDQLDLQSLLRVRERWVMRRTVVNQDFSRRIFNQLVLREREAHWVRMRSMNLGDQVTDGNQLRFAPHKTPDFLERRLFVDSQGMCIFARLIEARMSAAKFITARVSGNQTKIFIEFVPDSATRRSDAFHHRNPNAATFYSGLCGPIEL